MNITEKNIPLQILCISVLAFIVFSNTLAGSFIYDDNIIKSFAGMDGLGKVLRTALPQVFPDGAKGLLYRPLFLASLFADHSVWGLKPFGYHLTGIILHILNCALVFFLILSVSGSNKISFITACLFAVHPIQTESVAWISGRNDILFAAFALSSFLFHKNGRGVLSCIAFLAALFTKESALVLLLLFPVYDKAVSGRYKAWPYAGFASMALVYFLVRWSALGGMGAGNIAFGAELFKGLANAPLLYFQYLRFLIYPPGYVFLPSFALAGSGSDILRLASSLAVLSGFCAVYLFVRKAPALKFGFLWFVVLLLPYSGIIPLPWLVMEHRLYLASAGSFMMAAYFICRLIGSGRAVLKYAGYAIALILVAACAFTTYHKNEVFASEVTLWEETVRNSPGSLEAKANLSEAYLDNGLFDLALPLLKELIAADDSVWTFHYNAAYAYSQKGDHGSAVKELEKALSLDPKDPDVIRALLQKESELAEAARR